MNTQDMINHYRKAGIDHATHIVRHNWTQEDFQTRSDESVLNLFDFQFTSKDHFCDLGCGLGHSLTVLRNMAYPWIPVEFYTGIDPAGELLYHAHNYFKTTNLFGKFSFVINDGKTIPFGNDIFDVLISEQMFQHVLECNDGREVFEKYIREIDRTLKDGARYCFQVPKYPSYSHGVTKDYLENLLTNTTKLDKVSIREYDNWYWTITNLERNKEPHWLNHGSFKERDLKLFGENYVKYE